ncbi:MULTISPECIES: MFS transporter [Rhodomicrobium]|uniref:MFS transporter n=1 Tax=Rhodomicrobium TaxID=1068 RepID=UPI0014820D92|nr:MULTISPECIES: MFS transporter [Rhodomicrobium]
MGAVAGVNVKGAGVAALATTSRLALPVILLAVFVMPIGISGTAVALPGIARDLGANPALLQGVVNGFNASFAVFMLVWGVLSDRIGYKITFVIGTVLMVVGSVISAAAPSLLMLDVGRVVCGIAGAAIFAGASATLSNAFPPEVRGRNFAIFGSTLGLGGTVGPTLAGWLIPIIDWRGVFLLYGIVAAVAFCLSRHVPHAPRLNTRATKAVDFSLLKNPTFLGFALVPVADAIGFMTLFTYLPVALSAQHNMDAPAAGSLLLLMTVPIFVSPILVAMIMKRFPSVTAMAVIYVSLAVLIIGDFGMFLLGPSLPIGWIVVPMILLGFGWGLPAGLVDGAAIGAVPPQSAGTAAGMLNFLRLGSEAIAIGIYAAAIHWVIGGVVDNPALAARVAAGNGGHGDVYAVAFRTVLWTIIVMTALTSIAIAICHHRSESAKAEQ